MMYLMKPSRSNVDIEWSRRAKGGEEDIVWFLRSTRDTKDISMKIGIDVCFLAMRMLDI